MTWYRGYYITKRNGKRVGITYHYQHDPVTGAMINEREVSVTTLSND